MSSPPFLSPALGTLRQELNDHQVGKMLIFPLQTVWAVCTSCPIPTLLISLFYKDCP